MCNFIKIGDRVQVEFNGSKTTLCINAEVIYMPLSPGDSWIFKGHDTGFTYHVSEGCTVSRRDR